MAGAEIANIKGVWESGSLTIKGGVDNITVMAIGVPTTGVRAVPAGYVSVITTSATLAMTDIGRVNYVNATTEVVLTLPPASSTAVHATYTIVQGQGAGNVVVLSAITTELIVGCGWATTDVVTEITNNASTAAQGDMAILTAGGSTTGIWQLHGLVGTWASTT